MAYFEISQIQNDGFVTISDVQNFTFRQNRQAEMSIIAKIANYFSEKIQMWLKSVPKNRLFKTNPPLQVIVEDS